MAGHSKWAQIKHKKAHTDAKKGKIFTRLIRELTVASKLGGADPESNPRLRLAIDKAWDANMPKDNIERAIKRGAGQLEGVEYEEVRYEGYGPQGAALIIDCLTDNKVRTVAEIRHALGKHGGSLGAEGSVAYLFQHGGQLVFAPGAPEDKIYEAAIEAGAEDIVVREDGSIEIITSVVDFMAVRDILAQKNLVPEIAELTWRPQVTLKLQPENEEKLQKLIDALDNLDDVQAVYTNVEFSVEL